jgi:hypothetical protein
VNHIEGLTMASKRSGQSRRGQSSKSRARDALTGREEELFDGLTMKIKLCDTVPTRKQ